MVPSQGCEHHGFGRWFGAFRELFLGLGLRGPDDFVVGTMPFAVGNLESAVGTLQFREGDLLDLAGEGRPLAKLGPDPTGILNPEVGGGGRGVAAVRIPGSPANGRMRPVKRHCATIRKDWLCDETVADKNWHFVRGRTRWPVLLLCRYVGNLPSVFRM